MTVSSFDPPNSDLILYQTDDGNTHIEVRLQDETVWLNQAQLCELFDKDKRTISDQVAPKATFNERKEQMHDALRKAGDENIDFICFPEGFLIILNYVGYSFNVFYSLQLLLLQFRG